MDSSLVIKYFRDLQTNDDLIIKNSSDKLTELTKTLDFIPILIDLLSNDDDFIQKEACTLLNRTIQLTKSELDPENAKLFLLKIIPIFISFDSDLSYLIFPAIHNLALAFDSNQFFLELINSLHQSNDKLHLMLLCLISTVDPTPITSLEIELMRDLILTEDTRTFHIVMMLILSIVAFSNIQNDEMEEINKIFQESLLYYIKSNKTEHVREMYWLISEAFSKMVKIMNVDEIFNELLEELQKSTSNKMKISILSIIYVLVGENSDTEFEQNVIEDIMSLIIQELIAIYDPDQPYLDQLIVSFSNPLLLFLQKLPENIQNNWILEKVKALIDQNDESCYVVAVCILQLIAEENLNIFDETQLENIYSTMLLLLSEGNTNIRMAVLDFYRSIFEDLIFSVETFPFEDTISVLFELYQSEEFPDALDIIYRVILRMKSTDAIFDDLFNTIKGFLNEEQNINAQSSLIMILSAAFKNSPEILKNQSDNICSFLQENLLFDGSVDMDILNCFLACLSNCISCYPNFYIEHHEFVHQTVAYAIQFKNIHFIIHIECIIRAISNYSTDFVTQNAEQILISAIEFLKIAGQMFLPVHYGFCLELITYDLTMSIELLKNEEIANKIIEVIKDSVSYSIQTDQNLISSTVDLVFVSLNGLSENEQICNSILEILNPYITYAMNQISDSKSVLILKSIKDRIRIRAFGNNDIAIIQKVLDRMIFLSERPFFNHNQREILELAFTSIFLISESSNVDAVTQFAQNNIEKFMILFQSTEKIPFYAFKCIETFILKRYLSDSNLNDIVVLCNEKINDLELNFCHILNVIALIYPMFIPSFLERVCTIFMSLSQSEEKNPNLEDLVSLLCVIFCKSEGNPFSEEIHRLILSYLPFKNDFSYNVNAISYLLVLGQELPDSLAEIYTKCMAEHLCHPFADFPKLLYPNNSVQSLAIAFCKMIDPNNFDASILYLLNNNSEKSEILKNTLFAILMQSNSGEA
ncbi:hypothetical protein TVAG_365530 [Trichomonas vaginalis G3]|uniref:Uncharacterized protein n=1 Tax=Trichomonas vaginalis (strain ATCC PRA-98 / G3) TaxID=412133 RepID=A2DHJ7_TRIV3|nr:armadillo (ARM) repeat-containing protein family [Trichomonas vaginalis G3]EAY20045.1 hypothetical protein TVAG_365530 [Trichomonas vaginalis G3]KAI5527996.1 armadillo (ARM) repeat-containing protein family [Trichomonas vaginalis G3]|eukprot:XP_001581031.1 hypothetical protein [Trichomonas vaginalis G3]